MAKTNIPLKSDPIYTYEGAKASKTNYENQLKRSIMSCMLWENTFYEDGVSIAERIDTLIPKVKPESVAQMAIEARELMKLRHIPLWIVRCMAKHDTHKHLVKNTLIRIIQRPDELTEFLSLYWLNGKCPISAQVKKGLAEAFTKFNAYSLAKYNRKEAIKLRDVLFLTHAKPKNQEQAEVWKKLVKGTLESPDTWEVNLSAGENKKETWERLIQEFKLGGLALLRNLRNMESVNVDRNLIIQALNNMKTDRILPFRFISAEKHCPSFSKHLENSMLKCLKGKEKLYGTTGLLIDVSGSMSYNPISRKSDLCPIDAACGLSILLNEICDDVQIMTFNNTTNNVPSRRGFGLRDVIMKRVGGGTNIAFAIQEINKIKSDRIIVITDEQSRTRPLYQEDKKYYIINVASYKNGISYSPNIIHIDGWSESVIDYIIEYEKENF